MALTNSNIETVSQEVFAEPRSTMVNTDVFSVGIDQYQSQTQTVKVDILAEDTDVADYNATTNNFVKDRSKTEAFKNVTLDTPILSGFSLLPSEWNDLTEEGLRQRVQRSLNLLDQKANEKIFGEITVANFAQAIDVGASGAFDTSVVTTINSNEDYNKLDKAEMPRMLLRSAWFENLMGQPSLLNASDRGDTGVNRGGLPFVDYRDNRIYKSTVLTDNSENLAGFVTDKGGIAVGFGLEDDYPPEDQVGYRSVPLVTSNGIPVRMTYNIDKGTKRANWVFSLTMGVTVAQPKKLIRLYDAP